MTKEEALAELKDCQKMYDTEDAHYRADEILCRIIEENLGWKDVIEAYDKVKKWYA